MILAARRSLLLPAKSFRAFATRSTPAGPRSGSRKQPPAERRQLPGHRNAPKQPPKDSSTPEDAAASQQPSKNEAVSNALAQISQSPNTLLTPVHIPEDPNAILKETHPVMRLLDNSSIVVQRQLEMMNVLLGFEQANRYIIMDPLGNHIGYLAEQDHGLGGTIARNMFRTHRSFTTHVFDREEKEVLRFHRPFSWISSRIRVYDAVGKGGNAYTHSISLQGTSTRSEATQTSASVSSLAPSEMRIIGSAEQEWAPLRRKYNLFLARNLNDMPAAPGTAQIASGDLPLSSSTALQAVEGDQREVGMMQFARVDVPFLSWDFPLTSEDGRLVGSVNRNFGGFARELFTDTGAYVLRMDAAGLSADPSHSDSKNPNIADPSVEEFPGMTLDQRAVMLATAVSVDFDYFSRHSGSGFTLWPMWMPWFGGEAAGGAAAGEAGAIGAAGAAGETGIASEAAAAARSLSSAEGAAAGAGTMAGYEMMQRSREQAQANDEQSPQTGGHDGKQEDVWGQGQDPWNKDSDDDFWGGGGSSGGQSGGGQSGGGQSGGGGGEGGEGLDVGDILDWF